MKISSTRPRPGRQEAQILKSPTKIVIDFFRKIIYLFDELSLIGCPATGTMNAKKFIKIFKKWKII
jgi:hypothetical protein